MCDDVMANYRDLLSTSTSILLIDWPNRDVPDTLARHGFSVTSHDGPGPNEYNAYQMANGVVQVRAVGTPPQQVDIVYSHRPLDELPGIIEQARALNARAVWLTSGSEQAKLAVESAEMEYFDSPYIADAVREVVQL
jgi:predicted CoA-binding protein